MSARTLTERFPAVADQWHPTRNGSLTPDQVAGKAARSAWWRCSNGHEWSEVISQRVSTIPQWKNGNPAACRQCSPASAISLVDHTFPCGHTRRVRLATAQKDRPRCWECQQPLQEAARKEKKRAAARDSYHRARAHGPVPPEQRSAQRQLVGILNRGFTIDEVGVCIPRSETLSIMYGGATPAEVSETLELLNIPYEVIVTSVTGRRGEPVGFDLRIAWNDLPALARWAPTAARKADDARTKHRI